MLDTWRSDGFGADRLLVWTVGWPGQENLVESFAAGSTAPCLVDSDADFIFAYDVDKDDLWVVDATGTVTFSMNLIAQPITTSTYANLLDTAVRAALQ